jgi:cytochrome c-type biogenesis protein CcmE
VTRTRSPARLVIALSVAALLAVFLLYTSIAGGTPSLQPSELKNRDERVALSGTVVGPVTGNARDGGLRFRLRDVEGTASVPVVYTGSVPDLFRVGRSVHLEGNLRRGTFVGAPDTLTTKCPSKYSPAAQPPVRESGPVEGAKGEPGGSPA